MPSRERKEWSLEASSRSMVRPSMQDVRGGPRDKKTYCASLPRRRMGGQPDGWKREMDERWTKKEKDEDREVITDRAEDFFASLNL